MLRSWNCETFGRVNQSEMITTLWERSWSNQKTPTEKWKIMSNLKHSVWEEKFVLELLFQHCLINWINPTKYLTLSEPLNNPLTDGSDLYINSRSADFVMTSKVWIVWPMGFAGKGGGEIIREKQRVRRRTLNWATNDPVQSSGLS